MTAFCGMLIPALNAQKLWWEPARVDPEDSLTIYIDLDQMDCTGLAGTDGPLYIWSWEPNDPAIASGNGQWAASNTDPSMQWTRRPDLGANVWMFKMVPTVFYGTDAQTIFDQDISFLAKEYDGGGGGDCNVGGAERKTEDLKIAVDPGFIPPPKVISFPDTLGKDSLAINQDDVFTLIYDWNQEQDSLLRTKSRFFIYSRCVFTDGTTYDPYGVSQINGNPAVEMDDTDGDRVYQFQIIPQQFFNVPSNKRLKEVRFLIAPENFTGGITAQAVKVAGVTLFKYFFYCP